MPKRSESGLIEKFTGGMTVDDIRAMPPEVQASILYRVELFLKAVEEDSPDGFAAYYELIHGNQIPEHCKEWVEAMYAAHAEGIGYLNFSWRGSWKSTTISVTFTSFRIGKEPDKTWIQVNANDDSAEKITSAIAAIIENNPNWKMIFPNVVPDKERGWGAEGYWVIDNQYSREAWASKQSNVIDPTLVGGGIDSSRLIGKHPSGGMNIDDIHDYKNSISQRERLAIVAKVKDVLLPTLIREEGTGKLLSWLNVVGTPWERDDAYHALKETGQLHFQSTPIMEQAEEGEPDAVYIDGRNRDGQVYIDIVGWWKLKWASRFGIPAIIANRSSGIGSFWRMFMLNIDKAKISGLKYHLFPHEMIDPRWIHAGGADMATVIKKGTVDDPGRDYFSHCIGAKDPLNRIIVTGGVLQQCTQAQAEEHIKKPQSIYPAWRKTILEGDGVGEPLFVAFVMRNPGLRVEMKKTGGRSKRYRQEEVLGPWLENGIVLISDEDTPYLNALRKSLDDFPDGNNDIRDGLYWLCWAFPECLRVPAPKEELPTAIYGKKKVENPLFAFGRT